MPPNNIDLLSTQPLPGFLVEKAFEQGVQVDQLSLISTLPKRDDLLKKRVQEYALQPLDIVFTSGHAVQAVAQMLDNTKNKWRIYCTGGSTASLVRNYFGPSAIAGHADSAKDLADVLLNGGPVGPVVFFSGTRRREELPEKLRCQGVELSELAVYETVETPVAVSKQYDGILFYSPSGASSFFSLNRVGPVAVLFAIGKTTASEIRKISDNQIVVAERPSKELLLECAINYFTNGQKAS
jgi:uroporphyrinogen-III synthase